MTMCLGWQPRMHNAPVKNEEAFLPAACCVNHHFFFPPLFSPQRNLNAGFELGAAEVISGWPHRAKHWLSERTLPRCAERLSPSHQELRAFCHPLQRKTDEKLP